MKAIILTPTFSPQPTGNAVTVGRIAQELTEGGVMEEEFLSLTKKNGGRPWIRFLGEISREEIPSLLSCADIVLNTSDAESEANAIIEALTYGKVVVGRRISGNTSLFAEKTGFLFRNREELHEQILRVLRNKRGATETGRRAKRFIAARFRRDREQVDYLRLYRETADQRFGRRSRSTNPAISHNGATSIGPGSGKTRSTSEKKGGNGYGKGKKRRVSEL